MNFFQRDSVLVGVIVALFMTVTMYYGVHVINDMNIGKMVGGKVFMGVTDRFKATLAVFANIFPFIIYIRTRKDMAMRGVGIVTVVLALVVLVYYYIR